MHLLAKVGDRALQLRPGADDVELIWAAATSCDCVDVRLLDEVIMDLATKAYRLLSA